MKSIKELNEIMQKARLSKLEAGLDLKSIRKKQAQWEGGKANKGRKHSEETKKIWSERKIGKKIPKEQVEKARVTQIETKWEQTLQRLSKEEILAAQEKHGNHQTNAINELCVSFRLYKKLCEHYGIVNKKSPKEKTEWAIENQSEAVLVWKCSKTQPFRKIGKPKKFYSVSQCCRAFEPNLHKANMLRNMKNGTPYRDMFFEKIVP